MDALWLWIVNGINWIHRPELLSHATTRLSAPISLLDLLYSSCCTSKVFRNTGRRFIMLFYTVYTSYVGNSHIWEQLKYSVSRWTVRQTSQRYCCLYYRDRYSDDRWMMHRHCQGSLEVRTGHESFDWLRLEWPKVKGNRTSLLQLTFKTKRSK